MKDVNIPLTLEQQGQLILSFTKEILVLEILWNTFFRCHYLTPIKHLAIWCLLIAWEITSPTKDSWLYMNNSTFIICWIHSSIAANLNVKWWYIFFQSMFAFSKARNSRNIHLPKTAYKPLYPDPYQSLEKMQKRLLHVPA